MSTSTTFRTNSQSSTFEKFEFADLAQSPAIDQADAASSAKAVMRIEIGHATLSGGKQQKLVYGEVIELDEAIDAPVRVYVDDRLVAHGELVVIDQKFCVRVTELVP